MAHTKNTLTSYTEAKLIYGNGNFKITTNGSYVVCAVTGRHIPLDALRYWSVDLQEAYWDATVAAQRMQRG